MTPDLMEEGARIREARAARPAPTGKTESGGRKAGFSRIATPGEVDITHGRILYLEDVSVSFDGFKAINKLSLDIAPGELRCIIGPNGAGKTTMMDIITGKTRPDSGTVFFGSTIDLLRHNEPRSPSWASAASSRNPRCSSSSACSRTWNSRSRPTRAWPLRCASASIRPRATASPSCCTPSIWPTACGAWRAT
jgi:urea transport system ATP-binding protein